MWWNEAKGGRVLPEWKMDVWLEMIISSFEAKWHLEEGEVYWGKESIASSYSSLLAF